MRDDSEEPPVVPVVERRSNNCRRRRRRRPRQTPPRPRRRGRPPRLEAGERVCPVPDSTRCSPLRCCARSVGWVDSDSDRPTGLSLSLSLPLSPPLPKAASVGRPVEECDAESLHRAEIAVVVVVDVVPVGTGVSAGGLEGVLGGSGAHLERRKNERTTKNQGRVVNEHTNTLGDHDPRGERERRG